MIEDLLSLILGPLVVPECRRAASRGWLILFRTLAASVLLFVVLSIFWWWWLNASRLSNQFSPFGAIRGGLVTMLGILLTIGLVMSPAVLAGSLAGDKERGGMGLLLTTRVNALEIALGRFFGKLSGVLMVLVSGVPFLILMVGVAGFGLMPTLAIILLPMVVAFGAGGVAAAVSTVSRRGRDALLGSYLLGTLLLVAPGARQWVNNAWLSSLLELMNPYAAVVPLAMEEEFGPALGVMGIWGLIGILGLAFSAWRLRPNCLRWMGGDSGKKRRGRRGFVPPIGDRPMLWKELFIERVGTLGGVGRWAGVLLVTYLLMTSVGLGLAVAWFEWVRPDPSRLADMVGYLELLVGNPANVFGLLIQAAVGLRAGVAIASERERGTWDGLLTSPLEGAEIVAGKLWGSLYALRWLFLATVAAWLIAALCGAMRWWDLGFQVVFLFIVSLFLLAVGVRTSLTTESATRAMALTVGIWLGSLMGFAILASMLVGIGALVLLLIWLAGTQLMLLPAAGGPWFPVDFGTAFALVFFGLFVVATILVVSESRVRFDRLAGRMAGGTVAVAVDRILHGLPSEAVLVDNSVADKETDLAKPPILDDFEPVDEATARSSTSGRVVTPPRRPGGRSGLGDRFG